MPVIGTVKIMPLPGTVIVRVALRGEGHWSGGVPTAQVSSGANVTDTTQDCPESILKGAPSEGAPLRPQASVSVKLVAPLWFAKLSVTPPRVVSTALDSVIARVVGVEPITCSGNIRAEGTRLIGCWQALAFNARQMVPKSPAVLMLPRLPGQAVVATECRARNRM